MDYYVITRVKTGQVQSVAKTKPHLLVVQDGP